MQPVELIRCLESFPSTLAGVVGGVSPEEAIWCPAPGAWSLLEIVAHLLDEEVLDFRPRLFGTLDDPFKPWPAIDPEGWVKSHGYGALDLQETLASWKVERAASVKQLASLKDAHWEQAYQHPQLGAIRAGDLLVSWAAHDALHLRQIASNRYRRVRSAAGDYRPDYAGPF